MRPSARGITTSGGEESGGWNARSTSPSVGGPSCWAQVIEPNHKPNTATTLGRCQWNAEKRHNGAEFFDSAGKDLLGIVAAVIMALHTAQSARCRWCR